MRVVVVGSGPAGLYAAITASSYAKVKLIEKDEKLGGTCVLYGCIPSKAMLHPGAIAYQLGRLGKKVEFSFEDAKKLAKDAINRLSKGVEATLESYSVEVVHGLASLSSGKINVGGQSMEADSVVLALGTEKPNLKGTIASDDIPYLDGQFNVVGLIGGGVGGVEYGWLFKTLGKEVHIFEKENKLLPYLDDDLRSEVTKYFQRLGVKLHLGDLAKVDEKKVLFGNETVNVDLVVFTFGRRPSLKGFDGMFSSWIKTDERMYTGVGSIYAAGDVTGSFTAHEAIHKGIIAGKNAVGIKEKYVGEMVPKVIYTEPQIAYVGKMEGQCVRVNMTENPRAIAEKETEGFVKVCQKEGRITGAVAFSERAEEIVTIASALSKMPLSEAKEFFAPHPSYLESLWEALRRLQP
ncbi:MAG: FAD-dependent pyridine nucleotide-disulfideoxido reductase [Candidatus Aramenus sulfurataquae]|uniref:FAD-dependent pyridine nucleotide-disulfideoxido reductase n=1 Tax=Candidatus Aramenus sulfurataquae TaxID=1326980 RepID=W7KL48_9CREN|nr:MAG: FAD-dependent pyridine nucleotide-disulfideoxido reductase [Candidatus Aramenus sulfurataquae]